ncbi:MAG: DUF881 domain-containing protein [Clostridiaceae bacterium]|nr:DUF881 domain-containing protein [Clostridiaceae bacterium]
MKTFKVVSLTLVCLLLGITIAWQFNSVKTNQILAQYEKEDINELIEQLLQEKNNNENLKARLQELQREVDAFQNDENTDKQYIQELKQSVLNARIMAGLETVKGEGLVITVKSGGLIEVEDRHIEELVNELKASDVQAISVNDERIVAMSEIRNAGGYIMINARQLVPPYTIKAIGDAEKMKNSLNLLAGVLDKFEYYEFEVDIREEKNVIIPAVRDVPIDMLTPVEQ